MWLVVKSSVARVPAKSVNEVMDVMMCAREQGSIVRHLFFAYIYEPGRTNDDLISSVVLLFQQL
jgi:hypothetical protein